MRAGNFSFHFRSFLVLNVRMRRIGRHATFLHIIQRKSVCRLKKKLSLLLQYNYRQKVFTTLFESIALKHFFPSCSDKSKSESTLLSIKTKYSTRTKTTLYFDVMLRRINVIIMFGFLLKWTCGENFFFLSSTWLTIARICRCLMILKVLSFYRASCEISIAPAM